MPSNADRAKVAEAREPSKREPSPAGNVQGKFMATHNGGGYWTVYNRETGESIVNVIPQVQSGEEGGFDGDLGQLDDIPLVTTKDVADLIAMIECARRGIIDSPWEASQGEADPFLGTHNWPSGLQKPPVTLPLFTPPADPGDKPPSA